MANEIYYRVERDGKWTEAPLHELNEEEFRTFFLSLNRQESFDLMKWFLIDNRILREKLHERE